MRGFAHVTVASIVRSDSIALVCQKPIGQTVVSTEQGLEYSFTPERLYSYLAVQQLPQIEEILADELKTIEGGHLGAGC